MSRFLSQEWFADVRAHQPPAGHTPGGDRLVLEQIVTGTPDGDVRYRVVVEGGAARIQEDAGGDEPDLTIACDWPTAAAMAAGTLAAQAALLQGRMRIRGNLARLSGRTDSLAGVDAVPADVRSRTTF